MTDKPTKPEIRMLVDVSPAKHSEGRFIDLEARPVRMEDGHVRNILDHTWDVDTGLADLVVRAQADTTDGSPYAWRVEYREVFSADLRRVEAMQRTLRKITRGLDKLEQEFGYPESFGAYVARVGKVLGIKVFGHAAERTASWHDDREYRWTDAKGVGWYVNDRVRALVPRPEEVSA